MSASFHGLETWSGKGYSSNIMAMIEGHPIANKIAIALAGGVLAWGGSNISSNKQDNAVQDAQITTIEEKLDKIDTIYENVNEIKIDVAIVKERTIGLNGHTEE